MITIWKFIIDPADMETEMPEGAQLLHAHEQLGDMCVWAIVDTSHPMVIRRFVIFGTGHPMGDECMDPYVGTVHLMDRALVFHLFDLGEFPL